MTIWQIQKEKIVDDIFNLLMDKQEITKEDLLNIFAKNNSYIVSTDDEKISKKFRKQYNANS